MISYGVLGLASLGFGVGISLVVYSLLLLYAIYVGSMQFNSQFMMTQVALSLLSIGCALLFLIFRTA